MVTLLFNLLKTARPRQWVKNLRLYSALIFTGHVNFSVVTWMGHFWMVTFAVISFTLVATAVYFLNDLHDVAADRAHPFKKKRPIAAGLVSRNVAWFILIMLAIFGISMSYWIKPIYGLVIVIYVIMQVLYSYWLKDVEVVDVFIIAIGFFIRVLCGALVMDGHLSIWFFLCVLCASLFLAVGKRRGELAILTEQAATHRKSMGKYSANILDAYVAMFATAAFLSWALYTFNFYDQADLVTSQATLSLAPLSRALTINKWLMATIPIVIFGIMRYIRIIYDGSRAETPERVILTDHPLLLSVAAWISLVVLVLYWLPK